MVANVDFVTSNRNVRCIVVRSAGIARCTRTMKMIALANSALQIVVMRSYTVSKVNRKCEYAPTLRKKTIGVAARPWKSHRVRKKVGPSAE